MRHRRFKKNVTDFFFTTSVTAQLTEQSSGSENPPPFPDLAPLDPDRLAADAINPTDEHRAFCFGRILQHSLARTRCAEKFALRYEVRSCLRCVLPDHHVFRIPVARRDRPEIHRLRVAS